MIAGAALAVTAVAMQSVGKVFYGAHLGDVPTALFLLVGACATAAVFLAVTRFRLPGTGLRLALVNNVWTALSFIAFFLALKYLPPATVAATEIGVSLATVIAVTSWRAHALPIGHVSLPASASLPAAFCLAARSSVVSGPDRCR